MDLVDPTFSLLLILFLVAVCAGTLDTLAGGGGLITVPALLLTGVPPIVALGTNKLQGCFGTGTATMVLLRQRRLSWTEIRRPMAFAFLGSALGTVTVQFISSAALQWVIPIVLFAIGTYFLFYQQVNAAKQSRITTNHYQKYVVPVIGYYDGMFGPGTGSFFSASTIALRGQAITAATANAKSLNFATNIASLSVFVVSGHIFWELGIAMLLGQILGGWLGAHSLFKVSPKFLRALVVITCFGMLIRFMFA